MIDELIGAGLNRNLGSPTAPGEAVESELDRLIQRRSRQKDPDEESELWRESVRAYEERRLQMARLPSWAGRTPPPHPGGAGKPPRGAGREVDGRSTGRSSVTITRMDWRLHGDLLEWIATEYPGLGRAQFEAAYRLLTQPGVTDEEAERVEVLLRGCIGADGEEE